MHMFQGDAVAGLVTAVTQRQQGCWLRAMQNWRSCRQSPAAESCLSSIAYRYNAEVAARALQHLRLQCQQCCGRSASLGTYLTVQTAVTLPAECPCSSRQCIMLQSCKGVQHSPQNAPASSSFCVWSAMSPSSCNHTNSTPCNAAWAAPLSRCTSLPR